MNGGAHSASFLPPAPALPRLRAAWRQPRQTRRCAARCELQAYGRGARRWRAFVVQAPNLSEYPADFLDEVRRLVRAPWFISRVRERIEWPHLRFSGVLFGREATAQCGDGDVDGEGDGDDDGDGDGDGVPESLRQLACRADMKLIDVPPLVVQRAAASTKRTLPRPHARIVAVFETYGHSRRVLLELQNRRAQFEIDLQKQRQAWSDRGDIRRNETNIMHLHGSDPFDEHYLDYYL